MNNIPTVQVKSRADLAATVPSILGFRPGPGDLVAITMSGKRIGVTMRVTLPERGTEIMALGLALSDTLGRASISDPFDGLILVAYTDNTLTTDVIRTLIESRRPDGVELRSTLRVHEGRVYCHCGDCPDDKGTPIPDTSEAQVISAVEHGERVADSRDEFAERIAWCGKDKHEAGDTAAQLSIADWHWRLRDIPARDATLGYLATLEGENLVHAIDGLAVTARHTRPGEVRNAVLCALAIAVYLRGNGAFTHVCLDEVEAGYSLAGLVRACLDNVVPPKTLRSWLTEAAAEATAQA